MLRLVSYKCLCKDCTRTLDKEHIYCSFTCAILDGFMTLKTSNKFIESLKNIRRQIIYKYYMFIRNI
jgi:hypothetical protein